MQFMINKRIFFLKPEQLALHFLVNNPLKDLLIIEEIQKYLCI